MAESNPILVEVKKAIDFWMDKTYDESAFYSHILQIIKDNSGSAERHREQLERLIFKVDEMRESQRLYHGGYKSKLSECKLQEKEMDQKIHYLISAAGYSIEKYKSVKPTQSKFF